MKRHNSAFGGIVEDIAGVDTPIPGVGWGEAWKIMFILPLCGVGWGIAQAMLATTNEVALQVFKDTIHTNIEITVIALVAWLLVAIHTERIILRAGSFLYNALIDWRTGPEVEFELDPAPEPEKEKEPEKEAYDPEPTVRGWRLRDVLKFVQIVCATGDYRQVAWYKYQFPSGRVCSKKDHEQLTGMLEDAGVLTDYSEGGKGTLSTRDYQDVSQRVMVLK